MNPNRNLLLFLLIAAAVLLLWNVGGYGVIETSDARYAEIGREMLHSGDWLHPSLLEIHHYHKPPLTYWLTALGYEIFGVNPFGARFFLQLALLAQLALVYLLGRELFEEETPAIWAVGIYFSFPLVLASTRNLTTDAYLTTFALAAVYAWVRYRKEGRWLWLYLFAVALGLGFLTKGPVIFIAPAIFALAYNRLEPAKTAWSRHHLLAWGLFAAIAASWFVYLAASNPAFWDYFVERQTVERFSSNVFHRNEPFWYYWVYAPLAGMPWLPALPWLLWENRDRLKPKSLETALLIAVFVPLLFFSLSASKRIFYILPLYPLFALLVAHLLWHLRKERVPLLRRGLKIYTALLLTALAAAPFVSDKVVIGLRWSAGAIGLGLLLMWVLQRNNKGMRSRLVWGMAAVSAYLMLYASALLAASPQLVKTPVQMTGWMKRHRLDDRLVLIYDRRLPSVAFHLDRPVVSLYDGDRSLNRETQFETSEAWKKSLYNLKDPADAARLKARLEGRKYVLVLFGKSLPDSRRWLAAPLTHEREFGRWKLYY